MLLLISKIIGLNMHIISSMIETVQCVNYRHQTFMSKLHADRHPMYITFVEKKKKRELLEKSLIFTSS